MTKILALVLLLGVACAYSKEGENELYAYLEKCVYRKLAECNYDHICADTAGVDCAQEYLKDHANPYSMLFKCDSDLSNDECEDLKTITLFAGKLNEAAISQKLVSRNKEVMQAFVKTLVHQKQMGETHFVSLMKSDNFDFSIVVDETKVQQFVKEFTDLQMQYETVKKQMAIEMLQIIQDRYKQTLAKLTLDFGKTTAPLVQDFADMLKLSIPSSSCDSKCMVQKCLKMNQPSMNCFATNCKCVYDQKAIQAAGMKLQGEALKIHQSVVGELATVASKLETKLAEYQQKNMQMTYKFFDFLERQAVNIGGCDPICIDHCANAQYYNLQSVGNCLSKCDCNGGAIKLEMGQIDPLYVSLYAGNDQRTLKYFRENFI